MISIIVCTYNREKYLPSCLEALSGQKTTAEFEVLLIDNASTDSTAEICNRFSRQHPEVDFRYVYEGAPGLSRARNRGIDEARGDVLVFLDDDAFAKEDYVERLQHQLDMHPEAGALGGRILPVFESGKAPKWLCRWSEGWISALDLGPEVQTFRKAYPIGANMGFRRSCPGIGGGFNPELGRCGKNLCGGEEKDLFNRIKAAGVPILYFPDVAVDHIIPESRCTAEFIARLGEGVGESERRRCTSDGGLFKRRLSELIKWAATILLRLYYGISGRSECGKMLVLFRKKVSAELFRRRG